MLLSQVVDLCSKDLDFTGRTMAANMRNVQRTTRQQSAGKLQAYIKGSCTPVRVHGKIGTSVLGLLQARTLSNGPSTIQDTHANANAQQRQAIDLGCKRGEAKRGPVKVLDPCSVNNGELHPTGLCGELFRVSQCRVAPVLTILSVTEIRIRRCASLSCSGSFLRTC